MPSGVTQFRAFTSPPGADGRCLGPGLQEAGRTRGRCSGVSLMAKASPKMALGVVARDARLLPMWRQVYIIHNYSFKIFRAAYNPAHVSHHPHARPCTKKLPSNCASASSAASWKPGSWIDELKIAEEFGISRTPLREALKVLAAEGPSVTMKVRRGAYVTGDE